MMFLVLGILFRSIKFVIVAVGIVVISVLISVGFMGVAGTQINMITVLLPTIILVLGIADAIHFPNSFYSQLAIGPSSDRQEVMFRTLKKAFLPSQNLNVLKAMNV